LEELDNFYERAYDDWTKNTPMLYSKADRFTHCHPKAECCNCKLAFQDDEVRMRHHDHATGKYVGPAHNRCNLTMKMKAVKIPVFFHNLAGYDAHLLLKAIGKRGDPYSIGMDCIPDNSEKFRSFSYNGFRFIDTMAFMQAGLDSLANNLIGDDPKNVPRFYSEFKGIVTGEDMVRFARKGAFPYTWFDSLEKLQQTSLPKHEEFRPDRRAAVTR
jgi:hypothetical protein